MLRAARTGALGLLVVGAAAVMTGVGTDGELADTKLLLYGIGCAVLCTGTLGTARGLRMRVVLARHPWVRRRCKYRIAPRGANGQPALIVRGSHGGPDAVCTVAATVWRYRRLPQGDRDLLVCGDPRRWSVVAPDDLG